MNQAPPSLSSDLQEKLLQIICSNKDVTYKTLMEKTKRDRITVLQSVAALVKRDLVRKHKSNPEYEKSKLIFKATLWGKNYAVHTLWVDLEKVLKVEDEEDIQNYLDFIRDITDTAQRKQLLEPISELYASSRSYEDVKAQGKISQEFRKRILKKALKEGILKIVQDHNYDATSLLNERSRLVLKKLYSRDEIKELESSLITTRDNLTKTIQRVPPR